MKRHLGFVFALLLLAVAPACAVAATWSLGPNIGFSMLSGQNSTQTVIAWPGDVSGYMPGLRIGYFTLYGHLSEIDVTVGQEVEAGKQIARSGDSGSLKGPILHFEVRKGGTPLDPEQWLK